MIRGRFLTTGDRTRPVLRRIVAFPGYENARIIQVTFLVDTGADRSLLSPRDAIRTRLDFAALEAGETSRGIGGETSTLLVESKIHVQGHTIPLTLSIPEVQRPIPSVLGRDFMRDFALFMEERTGRVLFFDQHDLDSLELAVHLVNS